MIALLLLVALVLVAGWPTVFMVAAHVAYAPDRDRPEFE